MDGEALCGADCFAWLQLAQPRIGVGPVMHHAAGADDWTHRTVPFGLGRQLVFFLAEGACGGAWVSAKRAH